MPRRESPWTHLLAGYQRVVEDARERLPDVSPRMRFELRRKLVHVLASVAGVVLFLLVPLPWALAIATLGIAVITVAHFVRRKRLRVARPLEALTDPIGDALDATRRPHEDFPWAPVSFAMALAVVATVSTLLALPKAFAFAAFGILGVGDTASALIGVAYGRHKLPWNRRKSWEGTIAGAVAGTLAAILLAGFDFMIRREPMPVAWLALAVFGAAAGAGAETFPNVEDNLVVPFASLAAMVLLAWAIGMVSF